jgi:hypothetical protein
LTVQGRATWFIDGLRGERRDAARGAAAPGAGGGVLAPERAGPHAPQYVLADAGTRSSDAVVGMGPIEYLLKDPEVAEGWLNKWALANPQMPTRWARRVQAVVPNKELVLPQHADTRDVTPS